MVGPTIPPPTHTHTHFSSAAARSIVVFKTDEDKIMQLDDSKLLAAAGYDTLELNHSRFLGHSK